MTAGLNKKLISKLMENQLSPIPEIANSGCVSPELIRYNEKSPVSKSAKYLSPSYKIPVSKKVKKQQKEAKLRSQLYTGNKVRVQKSGENLKRGEKELESLRKQGVFKVVKFPKTGNFRQGESPKRADFEVRLTNKSSSVPRIKISLGLEGKVWDRKTIEKLGKREESSQFLGRRKQKALTQNSLTARHYDANCREVQDIMASIRKFSRVAEL